MKLTPVEAIEIFRTEDTNDARTARKYGVSRELVRQIKLGNVWQSVTLRIPRKKQWIDPSIAKKILRDPRPIRVLSRVYGVNRHTVGRIKRGVSHLEFTERRIPIRTDHQLDTIIQIFTSDMHRMTLSRRFRVFPSVIDDIRAGRLHREVTKRIPPGIHTPRTRVKTRRTLQA